MLTTEIIPCCIDTIAPTWNEDGKECKYTQLNCWHTYNELIVHIRTYLLSSMPFNAWRLPVSTLSPDLALRGLARCADMSDGCSTKWKINTSPNAKCYAQYYVGHKRRTHCMSANNEYPDHQYLTRKGTHSYCWQRSLEQIPTAMELKKFLSSRPRCLKWIPTYDEPLDSDQTYKHCPHVAV